LSGIDRALFIVVAPALLLRLAVRDARAGHPRAPADDAGNEKTLRGSSFPTGEDGVSPPTERSPFAFFGLVFVLSIPFWLLGAFADREVMPGLPVSSFAWVVPVIAASVLVRREGGRDGVVSLLRRAVDFSRIRSKAWYAPMLLVMPLAAVTSYAVLRVTGVSVPAPEVSAGLVLSLTAAFLIAGAAEELGWSGYATEPLQERLGALGAALIIGLMGALWHGVPLVQAQRAPDWIAWWAVWTVAQRVVIVWLFNNTGRSVFAAVVFHATTNLGWQLFPVRGSHFDPRVSALVLATFAAAVVAWWGPRTLAGRGPRAAGGPAQTACSRQVWPMRTAAGVRPRARGERRLRRARGRTL